jgi:AraC family transcriptional regulator, regulatory protein of adaptative response / DNA-3-methyladenine glycosylase II
MTHDHRRLYNALSARDARFDGVFFVGVTSTGIYCRPICRVKTPKAANCRFFDSAQEAEQAGFRPCLRCRPELAPGNAPVDDAGRIAQLIVQRLWEGHFDGDAGLEAIADEFALSSRQIRRIVRTQLRVSPIQLLLTRRLLLAKQLLTETRWPIAEVAFASGFGSLRRFNDAFTRRYGMPPTRLRRHVDGEVPPTDSGDTAALRLAYRPPYDWEGILAFLSARALAGVELVTDRAYARTVRLGQAEGWLRVTRAPRGDALLLEFTHSLTPVLPALLGRVRALFDLDARPDLIRKRLVADPLLGAAVRAFPGTRVPGAFHGFELGVRAILGQQVTVAAATTLAARVVEAIARPIATPIPELNRLSPSPERVAEAGADAIARLGIVASRARSLVALAEAERSGRLGLDGGSRHDPEEAMRRLAELPGVGPWTAHYIAMRALRWPDAFPKEDIAVRRALGDVTADEAEARSQGWRPWRSYAVLYLWRMPRPVNPARPAAAPRTRTRRRASALGAAP